MLFVIERVGLRLGETTSGESTVGRNDCYVSELDRTQLKEILLNYIWRQ